MIDFAEVPIGTGGVLPCVRCSGSSGVERPFPADDVVVAVAAVAANAAPPGPNVVLCDFEPFRHPALPALIGACTSAGIQRIMLRTDGSELARPGNAAGCLSAGVRALEIVRLAEDERHDALAGCPGSAHASREGVTGFRAAADEAGVAIAIFGVVPVCRHNIASVAAAVASLASVGAVAVRLEAEALKITGENATALASAVHTGAVNRVAVSVTGWGGEVPRIADLAPYALSGGAR